jgi:agmatine deiminase
VEGECLYILVNDESTRSRISSMMDQEAIPLDRVHFYIIPTNDSWIRDYGPNFLVGKIPEKLAANLWRFDSWGGKYDWELDDKAGNIIANHLNLHRFEPGIVLEGGSIDVNGDGVCLTTESCLLNKNRNGGMGREEMESYLRNFLGIEKVVWLPGGLDGDDTDGHIDNLARFVNPGTIVCAIEGNSEEINYNSLKINVNTLLSSTDIRGRKFEVVQIPMPGPVWNGQERLPASYLNFYIGNRAVLLPTYDHPNDSKAEEILSSLFPDRKIVPIPCQLLVRGLGSIHCITQQQPKN